MTYWNIIKDVKAEVKLRLIALLSESLADSIATHTPKDKNCTKRFVKKFYGAWRGEETAEEIIACINDGKNCKSPVDTNKFSLSQVY